MELSFVYADDILIVVLDATGHRFPFRLGDEYISLNVAKYKYMVVYIKSAL